VASYFIQDSLRPGVADLFDRAHRLNVTTSIDTNYDPTEKWDGVMDVLSRTDIFMPNETEALSITHTHELTEAMGILAQKCKIVTVKQGAKGATLCSGDQIIHVPSLPVKVVDTVGAGDSFDAGFVYGFLNHLDSEKALRIAAICGALSTRGSGGTATQPDILQVKAFV
jgi:sugar/nucleoside kinase (ribokinase family)